MAAMTFALGGMAYWVPTFFHRAARACPLDEANTLFGGITVAAGLVGTFLGRLPRRLAAEAHGRRPTCWSRGGG